MIESTHDEFEVSSEDGVSLAVWVSGQGRPLLLVHGTTSDHTTFDELVPHLAPHRRVYTFDRRGRGSSGDAPNGNYDIRFEYADVAAIANHIADLEGTPVDVFSHSFGAFVALGGAARNPDSLGRLVVYSPGFGAAYPSGALNRVADAIASQDPDTALILVFQEIIGMPMDDIKVLQGAPAWQARVDSAWSVVRECQADEAFLRSSVPMLASLRLPVLVLSGERNVPEKRNLAREIAMRIPKSEYAEIPGQGHTAHHSDPAALVHVLLNFLNRTGDGQRTAAIDDGRPKAT